VWKGFTWAGSDWSAKTAVPAQALAHVTETARRVPDGFTPHPKIARLYEDRAAMVSSGGGIDWACAEMLALGTLLREGTNVRLAGQDTGRGTFSQRHAALYDQETGTRWVPLQHLGEGQGWCQVVDTMLAEAAVLGFEYGFSSADPRNLVLWEAQFGDFANGAQVIIDQFISSAESKWQRMSGLVMLLPHGYEGQGPEHSSARPERYLQLCADNNWQVCNLTTPAQYFHALRRQIHRDFRKPLILMSPKSLLRHKLAVSPLGDFTDGTFQPLLGDAAIDPARARRVLLCSGKVFYDLLAARQQRDIDDVAILRVEQLYPFPGAEIRSALAAYAAAGEIFWVQEEPWNMGAWEFISMRWPQVSGEERALRYVGRDEAASPAIGSYKIHQREQSELIDRALRKAHGS
jgi:2-oxoglutarate dehydrogenase E1 component